MLALGVDVATVRHWLFFICTGCESWHGAYHVNME
jgi:hypothetical protein